MASLKASLSVAKNQREMAKCFWKSKVKWKKTRVQGVRRHGFHSSVEAFNIHRPLNENLFDFTNSCVKSILMPFLPTCITKLISYIYALKKQF